MTETIKYRIYPTKSQTRKLSDTFNACLKLYNLLFTERIRAYEAGRHITCYDQLRRISELKRERPLFQGVHIQVLQNVLKKLEFIWKVCRRGKLHFLELRQKEQWRLITYHHYHKALSNGKISVPRIGDIKISRHKPVPEKAKVKTLSITKEGRKWFALVSCENGGIQK